MIFAECVYCADIGLPWTATVFDILHILCGSVHISDRELIFSNKFKLIFAFYGHFIFILETQNSAVAVWNYFLLAKNGAKIGKYGV